MALGACGGMNIQAGSDPEKDLSEATSFEWMEREQPEISRRATREHLDERIRAAVEGALTAQGLTEGTPGHADLVLAYYVGMDGALDIMLVNTYPDDRWGVGRGWGLYTGRSERTLEQGTLIVDMFDSETGLLVWRGVAEAEIDRTDDLQKRSELVNEAVQKLMSQFPNPRT